MTPAPEAEAREQIDATLAACGWVVQDVSDNNIHKSAIMGLDLPDSVWSYSNMRYSKYP